MAKKGSRIVIKLSCAQCKEINYTTQKSKKNDPEKMALMKFCSRCRKTTEHKEIK
ncbi:50S ribosomal protein L33 [Patescibacteria group bacterium]|nr:50S ribosomal protein L33 [Patescibacteria group bacterium]